MREIKFRAWDKEKCKMYYSKDLVIFLNDFSKSIYVYDYEINKLKTLYNYKLMQYTGLKDKTGIKIYDGDIVELAISDFESELFEAGLLENTKEIFEKIIGVVKFYNGIFYVDYITDDEEDLSIPLVNELKFINVIGNIYENPELLGE